MGALGATPMPHPYSFLSISRNCPCLNLKDKQTARSFSENTRLQLVLLNIFSFKILRQFSQ